MIFQPNNHSKWEIIYKLVSQKEAENVKNILDSYYDLDQENILTVEQVDGPEINSNNFKIKTGNNAYLLRRYMEVKDMTVIEKNLNLTEILAHKGVSIPRIVTSKNKRLFIVNDDSPYVLFEFINSGYYRGTRKEIESAGREIGKLDKALSGLSLTNEQQKELSFVAKIKKLRSYDLALWKKIFQEARNKQKSDPKDQFNSELLAEENFIFETIRDVEKNKPRNALWGVAHFDLHPHNLLADGKEIISIIDLDSLHYIEKMRSLAFAVHRIVRQYVIFNNLTDYSQAVFEAKKIFLDAYRSVCLVEEKELTMIPYFIKDEALSRLSYAMKDNYFNNNRSWRQDLPKQTANIAEALYFK